MNRQTKALLAVSRRLKPIIDFEVANETAVPEDLYVMRDWLDALDAVDRAAKNGGKGC